MTGASDEPELLAAATRIDETTASKTDTLRAKTALAVAESDSKFLLAADWALTYIKTDEQGRGRFGPLATFDGFETPPPLDQVPDDVVDCWEKLAAVVTSAVVRARLHELCAVLNRGAPRDHDRLAVEAHLELARRPLPSTEIRNGVDRISAAMDRVYSIDSAVRLAVYRHLNDLSRDAMELAVALADDAIHDPTLGPGAVLGLLRPVVSQPDAPSSVDEVLDRARTRYSDDVFNIASVIGLQQARATTIDERTALQRAHVQSLLDAAAASSPLVAMMHLREAAEIAVRSQQEDLLTIATQRLQEIGVADLGLMKERVEFTYPRATVDQWIESLLSLGTWQDALLQLLEVGPPTGRVEENRSLADDLPRQAPLTTFFPTMILDRRGREVQSVQGDDPRYLLSKIEQRQLGFLAPLFDLALRQILTKWAPFGHNESLAFFGEGSWVADETALAVRRVFNRRLSDPEGAAMTGLPRIERLLRDYAESRGEPVWTPPVGDKRSQYEMLGALVARLERLGVDSSWCRFLRVVFCDWIGLSLRNEALHGERDQINESEASLVLVALLFVSRGLLSADAGGSEPT
ncbi:MAG TPA: hypothetical protein VFN54_02795 [Acidimicrobiales bacterium]|nr:hypothetical protein [Acidimicrobiales bacterium]